jgi:hypothetical protein
LHAPSFSVDAEEWVGKAALLLQGEEQYIYIYPWGYKEEGSAISNNGESH